MYMTKIRHLCIFTSGERWVIILGFSGTKVIYHLTYETARSEH